jgi:putative DNA-invertase from lambdoid prophage Rac
LQPVEPRKSGKSVYAYVRVSTERQAEDGASLDVQQRQVAGYAQMVDLTIDHTFVERGILGSRPLADRPEGAKLLARVQAGDTIIAAKLDRLFRSALDALSVLKDLKARGSRCTSSTSAAMSPATASPSWCSLS